MVAATVTVVAATTVIAATESKSIELE